MAMNPLEFVGRLTRAKENVSRAQKEIAAATQQVLGREPVATDDAQAAAAVFEALRKVDLARADLLALQETFKPL
jgi:hypothetical protein